VGSRLREGGRGPAGPGGRRAARDRYTGSRGNVISPCAGRCTGAAQRRETRALSPPARGRAGRRRGGERARGRLEQSAAELLFRAPARERTIARGCAARSDRDEMIGPYVWPRPMSAVGWRRRPVAAKAHRGEIPGVAGPNFPRGAAERLPSVHAPPPRSSPQSAAWRGRGTSSSGDPGRDWEVARLDENFPRHAGEEPRRMTAQRVPTRRRERRAAQVAIPPGP